MNEGQGFPPCKVSNGGNQYNKVPAVFRLKLQRLQLYTLMPAKQSGIYARGQVFVLTLVQVHRTTVPCSKELCTLGNQPCYAG